MELHLGNCLDVLKTLEDNSVDSIVTDPPYGLSAARNSGKTSKGGFMGKKWDYDVPSVEIWQECLRVLKHGGHLLAFSGTRTYHRMVVNIEDAGFEVRDCIQWLYGSGFPKSHNISKAIDKAAGEEREVIGLNPHQIGRRTDNTSGSIAGSLGEGYSGEVVGQRQSYITKPATPEAAQWEGWGTALKPANEPICLARKPLIGTVVENVLEHGTGALNINDCRIGDEIIKISQGDGFGSSSTLYGVGVNPNKGSENKGRWPSNVIMDEEAGAILDEQAPSVGNMMNATRKKTTTGGTGNAWTTSSKNEGDSNGFYDGLGGASRFFYCAKTSQAERNAGCDNLPNHDAKAAYGNRVCSTCGKHELQSDMNRRCVCDKPTWDSGRLKPVKNLHPTVKPLSLMTYLCRLVTPPNGTVLDPFMGSGSTGIAACMENFDFIGIDMEEEYVEIARHRIAHWSNYKLDDLEVGKETSFKRISRGLEDWFV